MRNKQDTFTTEEHFKFFSEFCKLEMLSGGPDPQIPLVGEMSKNESMQERIWRAGCYISVYNVPFAAAIWQNWSWERMEKEKENLLPWLQENWKGIVTRLERRCVRRPEWMNEYFLSYFDFAKNILPELQKATEQFSPEQRYVAFWDISNEKISRFGRYVALKLLESYKQYCGMKLEAPDIRPKDGWSPRITLARLYSSDSAALNSKDNAQIPLVNKRVAELQERLKGSGVNIDLFKLQVVLCEYRESYEGLRQYPGRSHDSELGYYNKAINYWKQVPGLLETRKAIFPNQHLGEIGGWEVARNELGEVLSKYKYTWSDLLFDYKATADFAYPVKR